MDEGDEMNDEELKAFVDYLTTNKPEALKKGKGIEKEIISDKGVRTIVIGNIPLNIRGPVESYILDDSKQNMFENYKTGRTVWHARFTNEGIDYLISKNMIDDPID